VSRTRGAGVSIALGGSSSVRRSSGGGENCIRGPAGSTRSADCCGAGSECRLRAVPDPGRRPRAPGP
jgi:hypothetical protein